MESIPIPHPDPAVTLVIILVCVLCIAFFSGSEAALISVSRLKMRSLAEKGNAKAKAVQRLREEHDRLFGTILLTENFFVILASSLGTALATSGTSTCHDRSRARSRNAAIALFVPTTCAIPSSPRSGPPCSPRPKFASGVGSGENVFVSCFIIAMTARIVRDS